MTAQHPFEDQGGARIPDEIEVRFGDEVAMMGLLAIFDDRIWADQPTTIQGERR